MNNKKWYIVQVMSNHEQKVKDALKERDFQENGSEKSIEKIFLPLLNHETKTGVKKKKPMFPGYIFIKVDMTDESWYIIRNTPYVTGIIGSSGQRTKPTPIPEEQIDKIIGRIREDSMTSSADVANATTKKIESVSFVEGDTVNIIEGDFANQIGIIKGISLAKQSAEVELELFGRNTIIELPLVIIKKA